MRASPPSRSYAIGEEHALVQRFWERLRVFALRRLGDAASAEDVAQETMDRVLAARREGRLREEEALPGFVFATARNICLHRARAAGREDRAIRRLGADEDDDATVGDALTALVSEERRAAVRSALARLGPDDQTLLRLLYFEQLDSADVAARLVCSVGALRVRKHRAVQRLAELLETRS
jgi:RNA polymerase sigma-70 factor (ECF subfamily)